MDYGAVLPPSLMVFFIDHGEDVDGLVALRAAVDPDQPDRPSYQPGNLEDDVD